MLCSLQNTLQAPKPLCIIFIMCNDNKSKINYINFTDLKYDQNLQITLLSDCNTHNVNFTCIKQT